jgi:hypothetical protein
MTRAVAVLIALAGLLAGAPGSAPAASWQPGRVQLPGSQQISTLSGSGRAAAVDAEGRVHVVKQNHLNESTFEIEYTLRQADGTWGGPTRISEEANARNASLTLDSTGGVHVVWEDITTSLVQVRYRYRDPGGAWSPIETLTAFDDELSTGPVVAVDTFHRVHIVWVGATAALPRIRYIRKAPGEDWGDPEALSPEGARPEAPTVVADALGYVHVAWADRVGAISGSGKYNYEIFYQKFGPENTSPGDPLRLSDNAAVSREPFLVATPEGVVHLFWTDTRTAPAGTGSAEIFYRRHLPGVGWSRVKRFTYDGGSHARPVAAAGINNTVNVAWEDYRHGNPDIYYRQITQETGWDPHPTRLTSDVSPSIRPSLVSTPGGKLVLLWIEAEGSSDFRVFAKDGSVSD